MVISEAQAGIVRPEWLCPKENGKFTGLISIQVYFCRDMTKDSVSSCSMEQFK